jgi:hypothetical protein
VLNALIIIYTSYIIYDSQIARKYTTNAQNLENLGILEFRNLTWLEGTFGPPSKPTLLRYILSLPPST